MTKKLLLALALLLPASTARADFLGDSYCLEDSVYFYGQFNDQGGSFITATSVTWRVYEQGSGTALDNGSMSAVDGTNAIGLFEGSVDLNFADGYEVGKTYVVRITGTADSKTPAASHAFRVGCTGLVTEAGTAQAGGATSITLRSGAIATDDYYIGQTVLVYAGTGSGQSAVITDYVGSSKVATVDRAWATNPGGTSKYRLIQLDSPGVNSALAVAASSIGTGGITPGSFATGAVDSNAIADGAIDAGALAGDCITSAKIADNAIDALSVADGTIDSGAFAAGAITAAVLANDCITSAKIADNAIDALSVADGTIDSGAFAVNAIDAAALAPNCLTSSEFADNSIDNLAIADGAVRALVFATGAIDNTAVNITETLVANPASGGIQSSSFATGAVDNNAFAVTETLVANPAAGGLQSSSFAANAIDGNSFAQGAADKAWLTADRSLTDADNITNTGDPLWIDVNGKIDISGSGINAFFNQALSPYTTPQTAGWKLFVLQP